MSHLVQNKNLECSTGGLNGLTLPNPLQDVDGFLGLDVLLEVHLAVNRCDFIYLASAFIQSNVQLQRQVQTVPGAILG